MPVKFANNAVSTLASGISNSATSITVASGNGALFPSLTGSEYFFVTLIDASNNLEIAKCTARSSDVLTVTRAQESTSARAFATGDRIELRITAQSLLDVSTQISALGSDLGTNGNDINFTDNDKARFGSGNDLQIYHDGSHSFLDNNTGDMNIESANVHIKTNNTENSISATADGSVELFYDNAKKFGTLTDGASVFNSAGCNFVIKCGDATNNSELRFGDSDSDNPGVIYYVHSDDSMRFNTGGAEEMRLENDGDLHVDGDVIAFSTTVSDVALKSDIEMIPNALDKIDEIQGYTFTRHNGQKSAGIIAQELEKVLPEAVREKELALVDGKKYKTVEYDAIHGLLVNCIKELKQEIKELKDGFTK